MQTVSPLPSLEITRICTDFCFERKSVDFVLLRVMLRVSRSLSAKPDSPLSTANFINFAKACQKLISGSSPVSLALAHTFSATGLRALSTSPAFSL